MTLQYHNQALEKLCRVCGRLNSNSTALEHTSVECTEYRKELDLVLQINIWFDEPVIQLNCVGGV